MLLPFDGESPVLAPTAFVAPGATLVGRVTLAEGASVWYGSVLRADVNHVRVGAWSNIQDGSVIHVNAGDDHAEVGEEVTVGHRAILHACRLGRRCLVGMGATVLDGARVGEEAQVAAGAVVPPGMRIPSRMLVRGVPARIARPLTDEEIAHLARSARHYVELADRHRAALGTAAAAANEA